LLRKEGYNRHALVCERHTGTGISLKQIEERNLPIPHRDMQPVSMEEQVVCFADKFFSKSSPDHVRTIAETAQSLKKFGEPGVCKFLDWAERFE
jgi:uncharacterized protein